MIHARPKEAEADVAISANMVEVPTDRIGVESDENYVSKGLGNEAKLAVGRGAVTNGLAEHNHIVFQHQKALPQGHTQRRMDFLQRLSSNAAWIGDKVFDEAAGGVRVIGGDPFCVVREAGADGAIDENVGHCCWGMGDIGFIQLQISVSDGKKATVAFLKDGG